MVSNEFKKVLIDQIKMHGLPLILLAMAVYYLEGRSREMEQRVEECHQQHLMIYKDQQRELLKVIESNTHAIKELKAEAKAAHRNL